MLKFILILIAVLWLAAIAFTFYCPTLDPKTNADLNILKELNCDVKLTPEERAKVNESVTKNLCAFKKAALSYKLAKRADPKYTLFKPFRD